MEITNNYNNYAANYATATNRKQDSEVKKTDAAGKTEAEKAPARDKVSDYYSNLQKKYDCVKNGKVSISVLICQTFRYNA